MKLLEKFRRQRQAVDQARAVDGLAAWIEYRGLLETMTVKGKLTEKQNDRLVELAEVLGVNTEATLELHLVAVQTALDLDAKIATRQEITDERLGIDAEDAGITEELKRLHARQEELHKRRRQLQSAMTKCQQRQFLRECLGEALPELIDGEVKPAIASRFQLLYRNSESRPVAEVAERLGLIDTGKGILHTERTADRGPSKPYVTTNSTRAKAGAASIGLETRG